MSLLLPDKSVTNSFAAQPDGGMGQIAGQNAAPGSNMNMVLNGIKDRNKMNPSVISFNPEANIALINKIKSQETEKSASKLQEIRNVLISVIKETDKIRNNVKEFKDYINNIVNLNMNFFNKKILKGKENLYIVKQNVNREPEDPFGMNDDNEFYGEMKIGVKTSQQNSEEIQNNPNGQKKEGGILNDWEVDEPESFYIQKAFFWIR